jgi:lipoprotein-anchoring transpeptidase ErfK/SrfK
MLRFATALAALLVLGACVPDHMIDPARRAALPTDPVHYASRADGSRTLAPVDVSIFDPGLLRQRVGYATEEVPGTVIIDTANFHLYLVEGNGWALRYGVAIGREGFGWTGEGNIGRRAHWPTWTPPPEMIARDPSLAPHADGMKGGPNNPLGARALYVYQGERDTLIRVHGTNAPTSIGHKASSGCFRMLNQDVIDLFNRVPPGAKIIVF